jgi:protein-L-isoaspartate(D-aspartate) O-methyltransferase
LPDRAPFDRVVVTAATEQVPDALIEQLADDGIMILPLGPHAGPQSLVKLTKTKDRVTREKLIAVRFVPLVHGQAREL